MYGWFGAHILCRFDELAKTLTLELLRISSNNEKLQQIRQKNSTCSSKDGYQQLEAAEILLELKICRCGWSEAQDSLKVR